MVASQDDEARAAAGIDQDAAAHAARRYIQSNQPYARSPETTSARLDHLQALDVSLGLQKSALPIESIADLRWRDAMRLI